MKNFLSRFDFKFYKISFLPLLFLILIYPAVKYLPPQYAYENSLLENIQLVFLAITFVLCLRAKEDKNFFRSMALLIVILALREISCGRTIFFAVEGVDNAFYQWKDIKYGYLAEPIFIAFISCCAIYFFVSKAYKVFWQYILKAKISTYNWIFLILGIIIGTVAEKIGIDTFEEMAEMVFYTSIMALVFLHGYNKTYIDEVHS